MIWLLSSLAAHFVDYHILKIHDESLKVERHSTIRDNVLRVTVCDQLFVFVNDPFQNWIHFLLVILTGIQNVINQCHFLQNNASYNFSDCTATQPISLWNHLNENILLQNDNRYSNFLYYNSWNRLILLHVHQFSSKIERQQESRNVFVCSWFLYKCMSNEFSRFFNEHHEFSKHSEKPWKARRNPAVANSSKY